MGINNFMFLCRWGGGEEEEVKSFFNILVF